MRRGAWTVRNTRMGLIALLGLAVVVGGDRTDGYSYFTSGGVPVTWAGAQSVRYLSPSTFPPGSQTEFLVLGGMGLWNIVPASTFEYSYGTLDQDYPIDHFDGYNDTAAIPSDQLDPGVLGVTYLVNDGASWVDMDILFSDDPVGVGYSFETNPNCDVITLLHYKYAVLWRHCPIRVRKITLSYSARIAGGKHTAATSPTHVGVCYVLTYNGYR